MQKPTCSASNCERETLARGMCGLHYRRERDAKNPRPRKARAKKSPESLFWAKVDKSGDCWEWTAFKERDGYGKFMSPGLPQYAHRTAWHFVNGPIPDGMQIDHMCHNRGCVNPSHLRTATNSENQQNLRSGRMSKSGVLGVHWREDAKKWQVTVKHQDRSRHVGYYAELDDAKVASDAARSELFSHFRPES